MLFSIIIPAHNEEECIADTLSLLIDALSGSAYSYELIVVGDHCTDSTQAIVRAYSDEHTAIRFVENSMNPGFGAAIRSGLRIYKGDAVAIYMADASDSPEDLLRYFSMIESGAECVFGSRFIKGGKVIDYPWHKLVLNRIVNFMIRLLFLHGLNDTTNAFKCYRREVIDGCRPFISQHFNLTVELPLKAYIRGYKFRITPISWQNRKAGISKLKIKEMGSRYSFMILYCLLEKWLVPRDYRRR